MKQDSYFHPLKLILGLPLRRLRSYRSALCRCALSRGAFLAVVSLAWLLGGCGSLVRLEYQDPKYGSGAVEFKLPQREGYAK